MKKLDKNGFTIMELLIASMVFTTVLLLCMEGITRIAKVYVKNASISRTNEFAKTLVEDITQQVRFGSSTPRFLNDNTATDTWLLCVSGKAYKIKMNSVAAGEGGGVVEGPVVRMNDSSCTKYDDINSYTSVGGAENIAPTRMRVLDFGFSQNDPTSPTLWSINLKVALGDDDLLVDNAGNTLSSSTNYDDYRYAKCRGGAGSEFCSVIELNTSATRRMAGE